MGTCARCSIGRMINQYKINNVREIYTPPSKPGRWGTYDIYVKTNPANNQKWYTLPDDTDPWVHMATIFSMEHSLDEDCYATTSTHMHPNRPNASTYGYPERLEPGAFTEHLPPHHIRAWATLTDHLANTLLPDPTGKMIHCTPDDFTLSHIDKGTVWFTNNLTHNYLGIKPDGKLRIPTSSKHFNRGCFLSTPK